MRKPILILNYVAINEFLQVNSLLAILFRKKWSNIPPLYPLLVGKCCEFSVASLSIDDTNMLSNLL